MKKLAFLFILFASFVAKGENNSYTLGVSFLEVDSQRIDIQNLMHGVVLSTSGNITWACIPGHGASYAKVGGHVLLTFVTDSGVVETVREILSFKDSERYDVAYFQIRSLPIDGVLDMGIVANPKPFEKVMVRTDFNRRGVKKKKARFDLTGDHLKSQDFFIDRGDSGSPIINKEGGFLGFVTCVGFDLQSFYYLPSRFIKKEFEKMTNRGHLVSQIGSASEYDYHLYVLDTSNASRNTSYVVALTNIDSSGNIISRGIGIVYSTSKYPAESKIVTLSQVIPDKSGSVVIEFQSSLKMESVVRKIKEVATVGVYKTDMFVVDALAGAPTVLEESGSMPTHKKGLKVSMIRPEVWSVEAELGKYSEITLDTLGQYGSAVVGSIVIDEMGFFRGIVYRVKSDEIWYLPMDAMEWVSAKMQFDPKSSKVF